MNHAPEIVIPDSPSPADLVLRDLETRLTVVATDRDGDPLLFQWDGVPADIEIEPITASVDEPPGWLSTYVIPYDTRMSGREVHVFVTDLEATASYTWLVALED